MEKVENLSQKRKNEPHRVIKDMSHTGLKTNSPDDWAMAKQKEAAQAVGEGKPTQQER